MLLQRALRILATGLCAGLLLACTQSKITESHVDKALLERDLDGVLVVAITKTQAAREDFEAAFAKAIGKRGARAVASYELVAARKPSAEAILKAAADAQLDTVLVTRYIGEDREEVYHPGRIYYGIAPVYGAGYYGGFDGYYGHAYEVAYEQPVWSANVTHFLVSDLYIAATQEHMWQAVSETVESSGDTRTRNDAISALIGDLKAQGLLP